MKAGWAKIVPVLMLVAAGVHDVAWAAEQFLRQPLDDTPPVTSSSQRFVLRGLLREDALKLSTWAERMATRLESDIGVRLPFGRSEIVRVNGVINPASDTGRLFFSQGFVDTLLQQNITVENPGFVDEEQFLEGFVAVLLYRYVLAEFRAGARRSGAEVAVPDWFLVGIAQRLTPELRERNLRFVSEAWKRGEGFSAAEILALESLPQGRVAQKAYCGLLVDWLKPVITDNMGWQSLFRSMASGADHGPAFWRNLLPGSPDARQFSKQWDLWLAGQMEGVRDLGTLSFDDLIALRQLLLRSTSGYPPGHRGQPLSLEDLVPVRDEPWMRNLALDAMAELSRFSIGRAPSLREVGQGFLDFFQALADPATFGPTFRFTTGGPEVVLRRMLKEARDDLEQLEKDVALRSHYMNQVQRPAPSGDRPMAEPASEQSLEELRQRYLDALEQQLDF